MPDFLFFQKIFTPFLTGKNLLESLIGEEQYRFDRERGYIDQVFNMKQLCEKSVMYRKDVYWALIDLEKA